MIFMFFEIYVNKQNIHDAAYNCGIINKETFRIVTLLKESFPKKQVFYDLIQNFK